MIPRSRPNYNGLHGAILIHVVAVACAAIDLQGRKCCVWRYSRPEKGTICQRVVSFSTLGRTSSVAEGGERERRFRLSCGQKYNALLWCRSVGRGDMMKKKKKETNYKFKAKAKAKAKAIAKEEEKATAYDVTCKGMAFQATECLDVLFKMPGQR